MENGKYQGGQFLAKTEESKLLATTKPIGADSDLERENGKALSPVPTRHEDDIEKGHSNDEMRTMYQAKKMAAQGLMDVALLTANASQLKNLLETENHPHFEAAMALLIASIVLQVIFAILCFIVSQLYFRACNRGKRCTIALRLNDVATLTIFFITIVNIFIASFVGHGKAYIPVTGTAEAAYQEKMSEFAVKRLTTTP